MRRSAVACSAGDDEHAVPLDQIPVLPGGVAGGPDDCLASVSEETGRR